MEGAALVYLAAHNELQIQVSVSQNSLRTPAGLRGSGLYEAHGQRSECELGTEQQNFPLVSKHNPDYIWCESEVLLGNTQNPELPPISHGCVEEPRR